MSSTKRTLFKTRSAHGGGGNLLAAATLAAAIFAASPGFAGSVEDQLDLEEMSISFEENFDTLSVSAWGPGTRWIAHTPWSGDFGGARFANPEEKPFTVDDGILRIKASRDAEGEWRSGLLASVDTKGNGFAQQYGYFEMRARLPTGPGVWPAFWLIGKDRSRFTAEIDVIEFYGDKPDGYSSVVHVWHRDGRHYSRYTRNEVFGDADPGDFHTYGVKIDQDWIRFYFDGEFMWKTETQEEHRQPLYILVNLALVDGPTKNQTPDPSFMDVDYVRAYRAD
ncbi:glycoside hydrolase family 16 protein [Chelativorans salis]|uniref:Glycoside hydrolase family 16 protein n=1 Tax=Chelativorans salis TaxID=2978478 RepID=A0ABT2LPI7_9HYPH|nr:glycoside hydrolase family 16 protein [Chelativorans sp. EGI FJ00035]MCT7375568.1 glycoside hydrolase family 16 protein [Chelativorans sp. EGI FJ00035]